MFSSFSKSMSPGRRRGLNRELYSFSSFTFNSAGLRGRIGPTLTELKTYYSTSTYTWLTNTNYFSTATNTGIQLWTVPKTGTYRIIAKGAQGSTPQTSASATNGGRGAVIQGDFNLTQGEKLQILVGQIAPNTGRTNISSSGGGGSWVVRYTGNINTFTDILLVAGGGGGTNSNTPTLSHASTSTSGNNAMQFGSSNGGNGGTNGAGGTGGNASANGAGGGFLSDGSSNGGTGGGKSFLSGGLGGEIHPTYASFGGGFGGGGSPNNGNFGRASGGGGYSGGGASNVGNDNASQSDLGGGGGGSYNIGLNQVNNTGDSLGNIGTGSVIITFLQYT